MSFTKKAKRLTVAFMAAVGLSGCAGIPSSPSSSSVTINDPIVGVYTIKARPSECVVEVSGNSTQNSDVREQQHFYGWHVIEIRGEVDYKNEVSSAKIYSGEPPFQLLDQWKVNSFTDTSSPDDKQFLLTVSKYLPASCFKKGSPYAR